MKALQTGIIKRFLKEKEYEQFLENYKNHRLISRREKKLNKQDLVFLKDFDSGLTFTGIARKDKTTESKVRSSLLWTGLLNRKNG